MSSCKAIKEPDFDDDSDRTISNYSVSLVPTGKGDSSKSSAVFETPDDDDDGDEGEREGAPPTPSLKLTTTCSVSRGSSYSPGPNALARFDASQFDDAYHLQTMIENRSTDEDSGKRVCENYLISRVNTDVFLKITSSKE